MGGREPDHDRAAEGDDATEHEAAREALTEQRPCEDRDQDRPDVDEHRRGAGVDPALGLVEGDVVDAEPGQAADEQGHHVAARGTGDSPRQRGCSEHDGADEQAAERERSRRELAAGAADADERARPEPDRDQRGAEGEQLGPALARALRLAGHGFHATSVTSRRFGPGRTLRIVERVSTRAR